LDEDEASRDSIFGVMARAEYGQGYFDQHIPGMRRSAEVIVPLMMELLGPRSVCDVGCGRGAWLAVFEEHGVSMVLGVDGDYVDRETLQIDPEKFVAADLAQGVPALGTFDLALSLEVAEHLPESASGKFVEGLVSLAPAVLFSAAVPGQGGRGHVNEQWPTYWRRLFQEQEYLLIDYVRPRVWDNGKVKFWYRQNALLFVSRPLIESRPVLRDERARTAGRPLSMVHPKLLQARLERPFQFWRKLTAKVDAGQLTPEQRHERMARMLERYAR
jgi:hypothetical protein